MAPITACVTEIGINGKDGSPKKVKPALNVVEEKANNVNAAPNTAINDSKGPSGNNPDDNVRMTCLLARKKPKKIADEINTVKTVSFKMPAAK